MAITARINTGSSIGRATITAPRNTTVVSQNYKPKPNIALSEIVDVSTEGVEDGYALIYKSSTDRYELSTIDASVINLSFITGGQF
jgi:hypothetical protein